MRYYTPLRYPGGKASLGQYMRQVFVENNLQDGIYVEPYAGGAGIALELLMTGYAEEIWLNDLDPAIYAFWNASLNHTDELIELIKTVRLSIRQWKKQREVFLASLKKKNPLALGFATLFLNRTNRSGILNGGVIGGLSQTGDWGIDARFNREELAARINRIGQYRHRIRLFNEDAEDFISKLKLPNRSLIYADPPYFQRGQRLYRNHYDKDDHARIARLIQRKLSYRWIVSYDDTPEIACLYKKRRKIRYTLHYSAQTKRRGGELMLFCDALRLPRPRNPEGFRVN